ncbi:MAG TPA: SDR family NAD(P)-dependent oxidoreductase, partial [Chryseolinea sp.]|nr:SDR family NAD(P)-dependent oxidoreductase [Chryseolinea sp.]
MTAIKKILVTGGAGYIGAHTVVELINSGYETVIVDNLSRSDRTLLDGIGKITGKKLSFFEGDCADKEFLTSVFKKSAGISAVMHFAAYKSVSESVQEPLDYYRNNLGSLVTMLEVMKEFSVSDMI